LEEREGKGSFPAKSCPARLSSLIKRMREVVAGALPQSASVVEDSPRKKEQHLLDAHQGGRMSNQDVTAAHRGDRTRKQRRGAEGGTESEGWKKWIDDLGGGGSGGF